jgi:hypothetical protein
MHIPLSPGLPVRTMTAPGISSCASPCFFGNGGRQLPLNRKFSGLKSRAEMLLWQHFFRPDPAYTCPEFAKPICPAQRPEIHLSCFFNRSETTPPRLALTHTPLSRSRQVLLRPPAYSSPIPTVRPEPGSFNWAIAPKDELICPMGYQAQAEGMRNFLSTLQDSEQSVPDFCTLSAFFCNFSLWPVLVADIFLVRSFPES